MRANTTRATLAHNLLIIVPEWHTLLIMRAKTPKIWHEIEGNMKNIACHTWHVSHKTLPQLPNNAILHNTLFNKLFQYCNHRCEVCEKNKPQNNVLLHQSTTNKPIHSPQNKFIFKNRLPKKLGNH